MIPQKNKIKKLIKFTKSIDGWLSIQEGVFLYTIAKKLSQNANIVEIGSWKGKSTIWLASAARGKKNAKVYAIDPHMGSPEISAEYGKVDTSHIFKANIQKAGLEKIVIPIKKNSQEASSKFNRGIDLLFIDGSHTYKYVQIDFVLWSRKIRKNGWIFLHDATVLPGPWGVARKYILFSPDYINTGMIGSMIFGQYHPADNFIDKILNILKNFLAYLFIISYVSMRKIPFPKIVRIIVRKWNFKRNIAL